MIFHDHDKSYKRLATCWKRAKSFAKSGVIDSNHKLAAAWSNCKLLLDAEEDRQMYFCEKHEYYENMMVKEFTYSIVCMDWFALKIDEYAKNNMLKDDDTVSAILYEWKERMFFNPTLVVNTH